MTKPSNNIGFIATSDMSFHMSFTVCKIMFLSEDWVHQFCNSLHTRNSSLTPGCIGDDGLGYKRALHAYHETKY